MKTHLFKRAKEETPESTDFCTVWLYNSINPSTGFYENGKWKILYGNGFKEVQKGHEVVFWAYNPQIDIKQICELKHFDIKNINL